MKLSELNVNGTPKEITPAPKDEKPKVDRRIAQVITDFRIAGLPDMPVSLVVCHDGTKWMLTKSAVDIKWSRVDDIPED